MMNKATEAALNLFKVVCECGSDHRVKGTGKCPVFGTTDRLNHDTERILIIQEINEFAKDGAMSDCVCETLTQEHDTVIENFTREQALSEQHPEWHLAEEISRSRRYFDQVTSSCAEMKEALRRDDSNGGAIVLPEVNSGEDPALIRAKEKTITCYDECHEIVRSHVPAGAETLDRWNPDTDGDLLNVDSAFRDALNAILDLPKIENATIQDLTKTSYEIWNEIRRVLCEFKRSQRTVDL